MDYITENHPNIKRIFWGIRSTQLNGKNSMDMEYVSMRLIFSLIDMKTKKENKGLDFTSKGFGMNTGQAVDNAEKDIVDALKKKMEKF